MQVLAFTAIAALGCVAGAEVRQVEQQQDVVNLMDAPQFFVCGSGIDGMDGKYALQESDESTRSDPNTPVYFREDESEEEEGATTSLTAMKQQQQSDFRLFRHRGFWMFADFGVWPPQTHFRCDPTKGELVSQTLNLFVVCQVNLLSPPSMGYSPARPDHFVPHLVLSSSTCSIASNLPPLEHPDSDNQAAFRLAENTLTSRSSEL